MFVWEKGNLNYETKGSEQSKMRKLTDTRVHPDMQFTGICRLGLGLTNTQMPTSHQNSMATLHNHVE